ncbi:hypothetical protein CYY_000686 [Polysphondylium violaceum]|uniref:Uncharacterized protein n=1 Tax=Polysphondylium violaceum TaxID=133409 RepID=A0A8J4PZF2_9MYCE|nr:hypothetical protein CYY_000686 [Polysphondylium violaceum]
MINRTYLFLVLFLIALSCVAAAASPTSIAQEKIAELEKMREKSKMKRMNTEQFDKLKEKGVKANDRVSEEVIRNLKQKAEEARRNRH